MNQPKITIIDYGVGNTHSVWNAIKSLDYRRVKISRVASEILESDALVLPGVGAFKACIENLRRYGLHEILWDAVLHRDKPILGICVGMQIMADSSQENGMHQGLGWIPGRVVKLELQRPYMVPHVGWNNLQFVDNCKLFSSEHKSPHFYFDHSYHYECDSKFVIATCDYAIPITAAVARNNIFGVQFHPEKSSTNGLRLFRSFFSGVK